MAFADAGMRATSLAASAALLSAGLFAAMSMKFVMMVAEAPPPATSFEMVRPEPPKPPEPERIVEPQITQRFVSEVLTTFDAAPPMDLTLPPTETVSPFAGPPQPPMVSDPHWRRQPRDLARYYPQRARSANVEGHVVLDCAVSTVGELACAVAQESPEGWGFGAAAQRIAREHVMVPAMRDGQAVEARYRMRVPFRLD